MKTEMEFYKTKMEMDFVGGSRNRNGTTFSGGTDAEIEFLFPTDTKFHFTILLHMVNIADPIHDLFKPNNLNNTYSTPCYTKQS
jgi:hypothetical protein